MSMSAGEQQQPGDASERASGRTPTPPRMPVFATGGHTPSDSYPLTQKFSDF